jgi:hypothetical protein
LKFNEQLKTNYGNIYVIGFEININKRDEDRGLECYRVTVLQGYRVIMLQVDKVSELFQGYRVKGLKGYKVSGLFQSGFRVVSGLFQSCFTETMIQGCRVTGLQGYRL